MPQSSSLTKHGDAPWLDGFLRARIGEITDRVRPAVAPVLRATWDVGEDELGPGVAAYVDALIESVETRSFAPVETYLTSLDSLWHTEQFAIDPLIRSLFIVNDITREHLPDHCSEEAGRLVEEHTREAIELLSRRSVALVTTRLAEQVERHRSGEARLMSLQRVGAALVSDLDLDRALSLIADEACLLIGADGVGIRLAADGDDLEFIGGSGDDRQLLREIRLPVEQSLSGESLRTRRPLRVDDVRVDPRVNHDYVQASGGRSLLIVPLESRDRPIGVIAGTSSRVNAFDDQDTEILTLFADQAASAIENARLYQQAREQIAELEVLHRVSQLVSSSLDLDEIFQTLYEEIARLMPADVLLVALSRPDGLHDFEFIVDGGRRYPPRRGVALSALLSERLNQREMVIIRNVTEHEAYTRANRFGDTSQQAISVLAAPLMRGDQVIGMISAQSYAEHDYRDPEARMLKTIASQAAVAIEHARLYRQAQNVAVAEERARLAREIHDTLAQGLVGVILWLERLDLTVPEDDDYFRPWIDRALELSRSSLDEARRSVRDLRAAPLEGRTLLEAIANLVADITEDSEFSVKATLPPTVPTLSARVETALFRVVQESISNARKHAQCDELSVHLDVGASLLTLTIEDDGDGFTAGPGEVPSESYGLTTMRERVQQIGGTIDIESVAGDGTRVRVELPIELAVYQESHDSEGELPRGGS